jgi:DNA-binding transcriptional LysR family regulator
MNFTLHQLKVFTVIVEKHSITKAAAVLNMTQPAVSIQLKNLQQQFDIPLTEVISRKIFITDFGKELYRIAINILDEVATINYHKKNFQGMLSGKLKISVVSTGKYVMPYYLKHFIQQNPHIDIAIDVTNRSKVIKSLENNEVDFSLVSVLPENIDLECEKLMPNKLFLTASPHAHLNTQHKQLNKSIFENIPLIFREDGSGTRYKMQQYFKKENITPHVKLELTTNEAVKQAVIAGLGYSILSILSIKNELKENEIEIIPVKGLPIKSEWMLVWRKHKKFSVVAQAYLQFIKKNKAAIFKEHFAWMENY